MTVMPPEAFQRLCTWLRGPAALNVRVDPTVRHDPDALAWECDGTLQYTLQWLRANGVTVDDNLALIQELGGYCDCEGATCKVA